MTGRLPTWLGKWLGVETPGAGEGTVWRLETAWRLPPWATLLLAAVLIAWVIYWYAKESSESSRKKKAVLAGLRLAALGTLVLMVAELVIALERTGLPTVVVLVDRSASMGIVDAPPGHSAIPTSLSSDRTAEAEEGDAEDRSPPKNAAAVGDFEPPSRLDLVKTLLCDRRRRPLERISKRYRLALFSVATSAMRLSSDLASSLRSVQEMKSNGLGSDATRLGAAVRQVLSDLKGSPPAAIVLISDGVTTDGPTLSDAAEFAARRGVPVYTIGVGNEEPVRDVELVDVLVDDVVFSGDIVSFDTSIVAHGAAGETVSLQLREKGNEAILSETKVTLGADRIPLRARLVYRPNTPGEFEYVVEIVGVKDEMQLNNNSQSRLVSVREETIRVLLVAAAPGYEFRFLKNMLERDDSVDVRVFLQDADPDYAVVDPSALPIFPVRSSDLNQYDVLILHDVDLRRFTRQSIEDINSFVMAKGGGLVWITGERFAPRQYREMPEIAPLLPFVTGGGGLGEGVALDAFSIRPTELGLASPSMQLGDSRRATEQIWNNLQPIYWLLEIAEPKPAARILAEHPTRSGLGGRKLPIILLQYVGSGKVLFHATDETWRWRFRVGETFFARYWVQSLRYLARSKLLGGEGRIELSVNRKSFRPGESIRIRVRFFDERAAPADDAAVRVVVESSGQKRRTVTLRRRLTDRGVFEGVLAGAAAGRYHALLVRPAIEGRTPAADFSVLAPPGEMERLEMDAAELQHAADSSHGRFYRLADANGFVNDLPPGRQVPIEELLAKPLWNRWWMISLFLVFLISEWALRKRCGML